MANIRAIDIDEQVILLKAEGEGTEENPYVSVFTIDEATVVNVNTEIEQPLTNQQLLDANVAVTVTNLPSDTATAVNQESVISGLAELKTAILSTLDVDTGLNPLTDIELRAAPVPTSVSSLPLPTGAATSSNQSSILTGIEEVKNAVLGTLIVDAGLNPLTDTELRAAPVNVEGEFYQATQPVSAVSLPLPAGAANAVNQQKIPGLDIPKHDTVVITEDSVGKLSFVVYSLEGSSVCSLEFTYSDYTFVLPYKTTTIVRS